MDISSRIILLDLFRLGLATSCTGAMWTACAGTGYLFRRRTKYLRIALMIVLQYFVILLAGPLGESIEYLDLNVFAEKMQYMTRNVFSASVASHYAVVLSAALFLDGLIGLLFPKWRREHSTVSFLPVLESRLLRSVETHAVVARVLLIATWCLLVIAFAEPTLAGISRGSTVIRPSRSFHFIFCLWTAMIVCETISRHPHASILGGAVCFYEFLNSLSLLCWDFSYT